MKIMEIKYQANFPPCPICGRPKEKRAKTCAFCAGKGRGTAPRRNYVEKICKQCGLPFSIPLWRERQGRGAFCSRDCKDQFQTTLKGIKSPRWMGGVYSRRGIGWRTAREWALIRAQGKCEKCGKELQYHDYGVHHKKAYRLFKTDAEANLMSNLIVLCRSCHAKAGKLGSLRKEGRERCLMIA